MFNKDAIIQLQQAEAISAASEAIDTAISGSAHLLALPSDFKVHDIENQQSVRRRARGVMKTESQTAFAAYVNAHAEVGAAIFVHAQKMLAEAVLNLGTPELPGHADNTAIYRLQKTAAFTAFTGRVARPMSQRELAEFLEDWSEHIKCFHDIEPVTNSAAVAAFRKITIESLRKAETTEQQLSASKSSFESISATSVLPLPTHIHFTCVPYVDLTERLFVMRVGINTGSDKPTLQLRVIKEEAHQEQMAAELANTVYTLFIAEKGKTALPVLVGEYSKA